MAYRFATERRNYAALASGQVLHSAPGYPAFPVRLASEIIQRCFASLARVGAEGPYTLYDPCCGSAYLATILAYLHGDRLNAVYASDIDPQAVALAERNLGLLTAAGLDKRIGEIASLIERFGKASHGETLAHATVLRQQLSATTTIDVVRIGTFRADASDASELLTHLGAERVDLVITDVPYGRQTAWRTGEWRQRGTPTASQMLAALRPILRVRSVVAIAANRQQAIQHPAYRRIDYLRIGKRHITLLTPIGSADKVA